MNMHYTGQIVATWTGSAPPPPPPPVAHVQVLSMPSRGLAYSNQNGQLYVGTPPVLPIIPVAHLAEVNPTTGAIVGYHELTGGVERLSATNDGSMIYLSESQINNAEVDRFNVVQGIVDQRFSVSTNSTLRVQNLVAVPNQPAAVMVSVGKGGRSDLTTATIFVNGVPLPNAIGPAPPGVPGPNLITTDPAGQLMYGFKDDGFPSAFWIASMTSTGLQTQYYSQFEQYSQGPQCRSHRRR